MFPLIAWIISVAILLGLFKPIAQFMFKVDIDWPESFRIFITAMVFGGFAGWLALLGMEVIVENSIYSVVTRHTVSFLVMALIFSRELQTSPSVEKGAGQPIGFWRALALAFVLQLIIAGIVFAGQVLILIAQEG